jgi:hypothetical protein
MDERAHRAAALRQTLFLIAAECPRRPRALKMIRLLRQAEPELFNQVAADMALEDEVALMGHLLSNLSKRRQWPRLEI